MKKGLTLLLISFISAALTDLTFAFGKLEFIFIITAIIFSLTAFLFYKRICEKPTINSFLIFLFLIALISFTYFVNRRAHVIWNSVIIASLFGYIVGMASKIPTGNKRIALLTLSLVLVLTSGFTVVSKIGANDNAKFSAEVRSKRDALGQKAFSDLIAMTKCKEFKCFDACALKAGFTFRDSVQHAGIKNNGTMYDFFPSNDFKAYPPTTALSILYLSSDSVECMINTSDKSYYIALKEQMDKLNFIKSYIDASDATTKTTWYTSREYGTVKISIIVSSKAKDLYFSIAAHTW